MRVELATDEPHPVYPTTPSLDPKLEHLVLNQLSEFLSKPATPHPETVSGDDAAAEDEEPEEPSTEEEEYYQPAPQRTHQVVYAQPQERMLTPRQTALWTEYCRLVEWKDYFYSSWWNANCEYEAALAEYNAAVASHHET